MARRAVALQKVLQEERAMISKDALFTKTLARIDSSQLPAVPQKRGLLDRIWRGGESERALIKEEAETENFRHQADVWLKTQHKHNEAAALLRQFEDMCYHLEELGYELDRVLPQVQQIYARELAKVYDNRRNGR